VKYRKLTNGGVLIQDSFVLPKTRDFIKIFEDESRRHPDLGIATPVYFKKDRNVFASGSFILSHTLIPEHYGSWERWVNQYPDTRAVPCSPLYLAYISPKLVKKLPPPKGLGKIPFVDADYSLEAEKLGFKTYVVPKVHATRLKSEMPRGQTDKFAADFRKHYLAFVKKWADELNGRYRLPTCFHSHTGFKGGYNMHARKLAQALVEKKIRLFYSFIGGNNEDEPQTNNFIVDDLRNNMGFFDLPQIVLGTGNLCFKNSGAYRICFTTTEVSGIPDSWVQCMNQQDEIWTTSEFSKKVFKNSGVKTPIYNMGEGIDPNYFHPEIIPYRFRPKPDFAFVSNFAWGRRKGSDIIFKAFQDEFGPKEGVRLVVNCLPSYLGHKIGDEIKKLKLRDDRAPITVIDKGIPDEEVPQFYRGGDAFVLATRGEGFGLPILEALACGLPVVTTGATGPLDYLLKDGKPLPGVHLVPAKTKLFDGRDSCYYDGFDWMQPSVAQLRKKMRYVFENIKAEKEKALRTSEYIRREWTWARAADRVIKRLEIIHKKREGKK